LAEYQNQILKDFLVVQSKMTPNEQKIIDSATNQVTIREFIRSDEIKSETIFKQLVVQCCVICGVRSLPDEFLFKTIWDFVKSKYLHYTFNELKNAFTMNAAGELDKRYDHFQLFDITFISSVMNAYDNVKISTRHRMKQLLPVENNLVDINKENLYFSLKDYYLNHNSWPIVWNWDAVYEYMDEMLMIEMLDEEKTNLFNHTYSKMKSELDLQLLNVSGYLNRSRIQESLKDNVKSECRKIVVKIYLEKQINQSKNSTLS